MDAIHELVQRLSQRVAPDEVEIAPDLLDGFLEGQRNAVAAEPVLGGFDAGSAFRLVLELLGALRAHAGAITGLIGIASSAVAVADKLLDLRERLAGTRAPAAPAADDRLRGVIEVLGAMEARLVAAGVPAEQAPEIGRTALLTLLEHPESARQLLTALVTAKG